MVIQTKPEIQVDIKPTGTESAVVYAPFNEAQEALESNGYRIISLIENAQLRMQQGAGSYISRNGNWAREGIIYTPRGKPRLVRNSPILFSAKEATEAHRQGREFYPSADAIEQALTDSVEFPLSNIEIPTNRLADEQFTSYAFGGEEQAKAYGEFLNQAGIKKLPVWVVSSEHVNSQDNVFARQMWFRSLDIRSYLSGSDWDLHVDVGMRGVKNSAEGTRQNLGQTYSAQQISEVLERLKLQGLEGQILSGLRGK
jgi:hypothetical protein